MPLFDFICEDCSAAFEELVRGEQIVECPQCGSRKVARQISVFSASSGQADQAPPCFTGQGGCSLGKCGSGRCGIE